MHTNIFYNLDCQHNNSGPFWSKVENYFNTDFSESPLHSGFLSITHATKGLIQRMFILSKTNLYMLSKSGMPKLKANINWKLLEPFEEVCKDSVRYGFRLHGSFQQDFYASCPKVLNEWIEKLSLTSILTSFDEDFVVIREISQGGTSKVNLVQSTDDQLQYAAKTISKELVMSSPIMFENLINEIVVLRKVAHENIVAFKRLYESDDEICIVTEYLQFGDGEQFLSKKKKVSEGKALGIVGQILSALSYLHSMKIMHRDVKLENFVFVDKDLTQLKLVDFGMSCPTTSSLSNKCGTVGFIAPEILRGSLYNMQADLFSVGVIFYTLTTGQTLFSGKTNSERLKKNSECDIHSKINGLRHLTKPAKQLVLELLNPDPELRISAAQACKLDFLSKLMINQGLYINKDDKSKDFNSFKPVQISLKSRKY